jgi:hypothetical protein
MRSFVVYKFGTAAALVAFFGAAAFAQQADEEPTDDSEAVEAIDEIIVVAAKPALVTIHHPQIIVPTQKLLAPWSYSSTRDSCCRNWQIPSLENHHH